ncbi:MAG TPA: DUF6483 family protein [Roseiflexaceae bacterium]|nr:DUF6483 family protein [Roseiflexaceae bacterium]
MHREDYILRLIAEFVQALHRVAGLTREGQHRKALESIDDATRRLVGAGLDGVLRLSEAELLARLTFSEDEAAARDRCAFVAALLREAGANCGALGAEDDADAYFLAALRLQLAALERFGAAGMPEFAPEIGRLVAAVGLYRLPLDLYPQLVAHHERAGAFAAAEDALHALLDAAPADRAALALGAAFYERLLARADAELLAGDLSRTEVEEALAELRARQGHL